MGKTHKIGSISKEQYLKIERSAKRQADLELGVPTFKHKVHKSVKDYNRQANKKIEW